MALLQAGVDIAVIAVWLGHESARRREAAGSAETGSAGWSRDACELNLRVSVSL